MKNVRRNKEPEKVLNVSYQEFLKPFTRVNTENIYLDNAYIQQPSKASILFFDGWTSSVIPYIKEKQLKNELNEVFQNNYPAIPHSFTYSLSPRFSVAFPNCERSNIWLSCSACLPSNSPPFPSR